jgi:hypothetical protein
MKAFARADGLFDVEAHLVDRRPFPFARVQDPVPIPAGSPLHDLWIRLTIDCDFAIREVEVASDITPFSLCKEAEATLGVLVGERIAAGWTMRVKALLRGKASCTHLAEMLIPLATTALQGVRGLRRRGLMRVDPATTLPSFDRCYAYARDRAVVRMYWPDQARGQDDGHTSADHA